MKWIESKVIFDRSDKQLAVDLISDAFYTLGVHGVVVEDPEAQPSEGWGDDPVFRPKHHAVIGFFPENETVAGQCRALEKRLACLNETAGIRSRVVYRHIDEEDWAESWKAFFWPEKISKTIVVKPTWRSYRAAAGETVLEIDPGMAFGTGTHPTTRLCINLVETHLKKGDRVLDIGTGSGILLIAAAKLGAGRLVGIDIDPVAVDVARKNLLLNRVDEPVFTLHTGTLAAVREEPFDLIVANILSEVIVDLLDDIPRLLKKNGLFICSGLVENNKPQVRSAMAAIGLTFLAEQSLESWVALAGRLL